jgi:hypothetical protein
VHAVRGEQTHPVVSSRDDAPSIDGKDGQFAVCLRHTSTSTNNVFAGAAAATRHPPDRGGFGFTDIAQGASRARGNHHMRAPIHPPDRPTAQTGSDAMTR